MAKALRVLVVEDEAIVAMLIEDMLTDLGHQTVAVAGRVVQALDAAQSSDLDLALLDVNLSGERSDEVARALVARGVPVIFATGYGAAGVSEEWRGHATLQKPFQLEALAAAIDQALHARA
jgi:CheY-like chemotaxis protein